MPDTPASPASSNASPARDGRLQALKTWLAGLPATYGLDIPSLAPASSDASFRRYFRLTATSPQGSLIVMDAPPPQEDCRPFVHADQVFGAAGLTVPGVLEADVAQGFLLLGDLGNQTYLSVPPARRW